MICDPGFFDPVASKELRVNVSGLESTLADIPVSVDFKEIFVCIDSKQFSMGRSRVRVIPSQKAYKLEQHLPLK